MIARAPPARGPMRLQDGSRVAVIGGGPAGSLSAYFLLRFAEQQNLRLAVDIYEPRDFAATGPRGCNMCGGVVSEALVQGLAAEGIDLPATVVQRGIAAYVLNTDEGSVRIRTPRREARIATLHRGGGPRDLSVLRWGGLDGFLLSEAQRLGARVIPARVTGARWQGGRPSLQVRGASTVYDLIVVATGVNVASEPLFAGLGLRHRPAETSRAYITEIRLGFETVTRIFGAAMHIFLLDIPRLEFAAIIPKGDFVTVCLLGRNIDHLLIRVFFAHPAVTRWLPPGTSHEGVCHCRPNINVREAARPFADRVVLVGDCGVTRLYKDGIGAAYRTARAAAQTAVFHGISARAFRRHFGPVYRSIAWDNRFGRVMFLLAGLLKTVRLLRGAVLHTTAAEQTGRDRDPRLSGVLWDMFSGSAPYRSIFLRAVDPRLVARLAWATVRARRAAAVQQEPV
ncbi:MAG: hypothetical protein QN141_04210 [Armatimonadota bacterium]|nr:hypothetical protein [Armatimonadota bacterium]MDR7450567.1 hypothetical protein [Armatimonadota bacterium]MDR7466300.1 hypothetical protein [Armatimonadota bacterium]MDR7493021.1 hypothetical protein [Armatimonadota bacterium]MDR7498222.1 hypothetical protein [Armatimonadota bacterium]